MVPDEHGGVDHRVFLDVTLPHLDAVYRVARHAASDRWEADDLVQETYLRAFAGFAGHTGPSTRAWLVTICLNVARSQARARRRRPAEQLAAEVAPIADEESAVFEQVAASLDRDAVAAALAVLPHEQRVCIVLMDLAGHTAAEVAQILGCPRGTVLARVHRGRRKLAQTLVAAGVCDGLA